MLRLVKNLLFSKESMHDRDFNLDTDFVCGAPLGLRIGFANMPPSFHHPQWLQDCMSNALADIMTWIESDSYLQGYYSVTGVAFPTNAVIIYMPSAMEGKVRIDRSTTYISTCIASVAAQMYRAHALKMESLFPGTAEEFQAAFGRPLVVSVRFFQLDAEDPIGDAYNYVRFLAESVCDRSQHCDPTDDEHSNDEHVNDEHSNDEHTDDEQHSNDEPSNDEPADDAPVWPLSFLFARDCEHNDDEQPIICWHVVKKDANGAFKPSTTRFLMAAICSRVVFEDLLSTPSQDEDEAQIQVNLIGKTAE